MKPQSQCVQSVRCASLFFTAVLFVAFCSTEAGTSLSFHLQYLPLSVKRQCRLVSTELCRAAQWGVEGET